MNNPNWGQMFKCFWVLLHHTETVTQTWDKEVNKASPTHWYMLAFIIHPIELQETYGGGYGRKHVLSASLSSTYPSCPVVCFWKGHFSSQPFFFKIPPPLEMGAAARSSFWWPFSLFTCFCREGNLLLPVFFCNGMVDWWKDENGKCIAMLELEFQNMWKTVCNIFIPR